MKKNQLIIACILLLAACGKNDKSGDLPFTSIGSSKDQPGLGETPGEPLGTDFVLPPGIRLVDRPGHAFDPDLKKLYGNTNTFYVPIHIVNDDTTKGDRMIEFQPGLIMLATAPSSVQNGMLMDRVRINLPPKGSGPGGIQDTTTIYLGMACLNSHKEPPLGGGPSGPSENYPISVEPYLVGKITTDPNLIKLMSLLEGRNLRLKQHYDPKDSGTKGPWNEVYEEIQHCVWQITDGDGLNKLMLEMLMEKLKNY